MGKRSKTFVFDDDDKQEVEKIVPIDKVDSKLKPDKRNFGKNVRNKSITSRKSILD